MNVMLDSVTRRAVGSPELRFPCPRCAGTVKGKNVIRHLEQVHGSASPDDGCRPASWVGPARLIARPLVGLPVLAASLVALARIRGWSHDDRWVYGAALAVAIGLMLGAVATLDTRLFRGRLSVRGERVVLSHTLGLRRRRLGHVDHLEFGPAYERRHHSNVGPASSGGGGASIDVASGSYLRLSSGRRHITVHCKHGATLRKTWTGWSHGRRRRRWHVTLDAAQFVELQYVLADLGLLSIRHDGR